MEHLVTSENVFCADFTDNDKYQTDLTSVTGTEERRGKEIRQGVGVGKERLVVLFLVKMQSQRTRTEILE